MTFDLARIAASKEARRRRMAALPFIEKLRILDAMRQRDVLLCKARSAGDRPPSPSAAGRLGPKGREG